MRFSKFVRIDVYRYLPTNHNDIRQRRGFPGIVQRWTREGAEEQSAIRIYAAR